MVNYEARDRVDEDDRGSPQHPVPWVLRILLKNISRTQPCLICIWLFCCCCCLGVWVFVVVVVVVVVVLVCTNKDLLAREDGSI